MPLQRAQLVWWRAVTLAGPAGENDRFLVVLDLLRTARHSSSTMLHALALGRTQLRATPADLDAKDAVRLLAPHDRLAGQAHRRRRSRHRRLDPNSPRPTDASDIRRPACGQAVPERTRTAATRSPAVALDVADAARAGDQCADGDDARRAWSGPDEEQDECVVAGVGTDDQGVPDLVVAEDRRMGVGPLAGQQTAPTV